MLWNRPCDRRRRSPDVLSAVYGPAYNGMPPRTRRIGERGDLAPLGADSRQIVDGACTTASIADRSSRAWSGLLPGRTKSLTPLEQAISMIRLIVEGSQKPPLELIKSGMVIMAPTIGVTPRLSSASIHADSADGLENGNSIA